MKFRHLLLRLAQRRRRRKRLGDRFAFHPARQAEVGAMATVIPFRAVAVGFAAFARSAGDRAAAKVADGSKFAEQVGSFGLQLRQRVGYSDPLLLAYLDAKIIATKKGTKTIPHSHVARPPMPKD